MFSIILETLGIQWILLSTIIGLILYTFVLKTWSYFGKQNVKFIRGIPFLGTQYMSILGLESILQSWDKMYYRFPKEKVFGIYTFFGCPSYVIRDPELVKQVGSKDFEHFKDHGFQVTKSTDSTFSRTLFMLSGQRWKEMRQTLSSAFTGKKIRLSFSLMDPVINNLCAFLNKEVASGREEFDIKPILTQMASDIIATCAFGLEVDSFSDPNNEFHLAGHSLSNFKGITGFVLFGYFSIPKIMNMFKVRLLNKKTCEYMTKVVMDTIAYREEHKIVRNDMIDLLMQMQKGTLSVEDEFTDTDTVDDTLPKKNLITTNKWSDEDLVAQCVLFYIAGFDSITTTISFAAHELAVNPDLQQRLYDEVAAVEKKLIGKPLNFDELQKMKYLDMFLSESLRLWTFGNAQDRRVVKPYAIDIGNGHRLQFKVGDCIWLPAHCLHNDEKYFPNPRKFDPERFSDERKHEIISGTYFPFGIGQRNCIASRFAMVECKLVLYKLVSTFKIETTKNTHDPMVLMNSFFGIYPKKGHFVKLSPRKK